MSNNENENENENYLWTGQSVFCECGHHVEFHKTGIATLVFWDSFYSICHYKGNDKDNPIDCKCQEFTPYKGDFKP
jgi:hypothetical protein